MTIRIAAIEVSHWHALNDAAYLRLLITMPDVELVGIHDDDAGLDMFLHLTGEEAHVTGAQLSARAHQRAVEDYASVMLRSTSGILGTVEVGNGFPRDGTDGEWKIAGRDGILTMKDGILKLATAAGDETLPGTDVTAPYFTALRDALDHWQKGAAPPISVRDCARAVRLIDQAYACAARIG